MEHLWDELWVCYCLAIEAGEESVAETLRLALKSLEKVMKGSRQ